MSNARISKLFTDSELTFKTRKRVWRRPTSARWITAGLVGLIVASSSSILSQDASAATLPGTSGFTLDDLRSGQLSELSLGARVTAHDDLPAERTGLVVAQAKNGTVGILDESLVTAGFLSAATTNSVTLSWDPYSASTKYLVSRDGVLIANLPAGSRRYIDSAVTAGQTYRYRVVPDFPADTKISDAKSWSPNVLVPKSPEGSDAVSKYNSLSAQAQAVVAAVAATTTVSYVTFIPNARVAAPNSGCSYGNGYQFAGDNRTYSWTASSYRTAVHAVITWSNQSISSNTSIGSTKVYTTNNNSLVATRTASGANSYARKMSNTPTGYVDVQLLTNASNPFCSVGAIDGGIQIRLTNTNSFSVIGGNHRLMPSTHVYIYNGGKSTDVYRADAGGVNCLLGNLVCELRSFYGSGTF